MIFLIFLTPIERLENIGESQVKLVLNVELRIVAPLRTVLHLRKLDRTNSMFRAFVLPLADIEPVENEQYLMVVKL